MKGKYFKLKVLAIVSFCLITVGFTGSYKLFCEVQKRVDEEIEKKLTYTTKEILKTDKDIKYVDLIKYNGDNVEIKKSQDDYNHITVIYKDKYFDNAVVFDKKNENKIDVVTKTIKKEEFSRFNFIGKIIENKCDKLFEKYGIFTFMFLAIFSIVEMFLGLHYLIGITEMLGIYVVSMSFLVRTNKGIQTKEGKLLTFVNIIYVLLLGLFAFRGTGNFLTVGFDLAFIMSIVNLILIFIFSKGIFSLVLISLICAVIFIVLGGIWFLFVGIIIFGVGLATFLTPVVLTALSTLSLNSNAVPIIDVK